MAINQTRLQLRFQAATGCTQQKAEQLTKQYLWLSGLEMLRDHFTDQSGSRYYIDATQLQNTLNTVMVKGQRFYVWKTFQSFPERVFDIIRVGSNLNQEYTMAQARYTMEEVLMAAGTPEELWSEIYSKTYATEMQIQDYDIAQIDQRSLSNYIKSNLSQDRDRAQTPAALREEWDRNLKHAQKIWMLAEAGSGALYQIRNNSAFGRKYYKGPNLQNTPKTVRHAALGACHEYDLESSVFAWKLSWFRQICQHHSTFISMPATLEYLDHKQAIRQRLAQAVFDTTEDWAVGVVKEFITAIGFGAPARGVGYMADGRYQKPALAQIITTRTRLDRALSDTWVQEFMQEQSDMNEAIFALARVNMISELRQVPELWEKGLKKLKPNSVISYLYQHAEREILTWFETQCADSEILLTVHDCIYTRHPVNLLELRVGLKTHGEFYKISHEKHEAWTWDPDMLDHPRRMAEEQARAESIFGTLSRPQVRLAVPTDDKKPDGHYTGSCDGGSGENYDADFDPAVDDPAVYDQWRNNQISKWSRV